ncbi:putative two-component system protein, hydrogenase maturation factor HypX/HoxX [Actinacidiphila yanglinensis]|uniref:Putative two-component system protein, hydrogenase maturation factor HypX/HoxX n=1 Tax=Actinacidiphila yanglinensis TaxID=310779 RepID=A0A1H5VSG4_9ACTN|nr:hydrogenase maturation protein [Actinacidiphila yanglinensis]SEF90170.1 putative two-component system protein, hydrogenase maturation factor HypX/HoxX [Actinacidiphila yanglinensis]
MRVLLIASAFNSLTQRVQVELRDRGHAVAVALVHDAATVRAAAGGYDPELIIAPMLTTAVPEDVWSRYTCLIVHPGPPGDRGPSSLDRAIQEGQTTWGVTVLQAVAEMDAGDVWASASFDLPPAGKSDVYRGELADAAVAAVLRAVERFASGDQRAAPQPADGRGARPYLPQSERRIDWYADTTAQILRTLRAADSRPGVLDELAGGEWFLHGGHPEDRLCGEPGRIIATRAQAICRATVDGAVWIPQLRARRTPGGPAGVKLPAALALGAALPRVPDLPAPLRLPPGRSTFSDIRYRERDGVGLVGFSFPGGAMSAGTCRRLLAAYRYACTRPTAVVVLGGSRDFFSNGIDLNVIEAAADPAAESWANIHAMNDLVEAVLTTTDRLVVSALGGNAAAGGVMLAIAADEVWCRSGAVLNPHYRLMGLPGSEYWTYSLPRRVGPEAAETLTRVPEPLGAASAQRAGLVDRVLPSTPRGFTEHVMALAAGLAGDPTTHQRLADKKAARARDEAARPLAAYRAEELALMQRVFFDPAAAYHALRRAFVRKEPRPAAEAEAGVRVEPEAVPPGQRVRQAALPST